MNKFVESLASIGIHIGLVLLHCVVIFAVLFFPFKIAYDSGHENGFDEGYENGHKDGYEEGYEEGVDEARQEAADYIMEEYGDDYEY